MRDKWSLLSGAISFYLKLSGIELSLYTLWSQFCYFYFPSNKVKIDHFAYTEQISDLIPFPRDI